MEEVELKQLLQIISKRWWIISIFVVSTLLIGIVYTFYITKPVYQSDTSIYIGKKSDTQAMSIMYDDVMLNDRLVKDYRELVKSRLIANEVIREMNISDINYAQLANKINVTSKEDTRLLVIKVIDTNPELAKNIADKVAEAFQKKAVDIMKVENIQIIDKAVTPIDPVKPNKTINIAVSFMVGFILGIFVILLIEYFNDTVKTPDDVIKYLDISEIGTIPVLPD